jgi:hypothetical protein
MTVDAETVFLAFAQTARPTSGDYSIAELRVSGSHLAIGREGWPALVIPVRGIGVDAVRLTHGLAFRTAEVELIVGGQRSRHAAAVLECRTPELTRTFAAMAAAIALRVAEKQPATLEFVSRLLSEWEDLLSRRGVLSREGELGLWAELCVLSRSSRSDVLLAGWCGPDGDSVDFLLDGLGVEVKASHKERTHVVSQSQVHEGGLKRFLLSAHVAVDPLRGQPLSNLVASVAARVTDTAGFEEKLAAVGYSREDERAYFRRYVLLSRPYIYRSADVPKVRLADPGISQIRYRVELPPESIPTSEAEALMRTLGVEFAALEYPCV